MIPPVDNSSCDPPCLMPKSFCNEVRTASRMTNSAGYEKDRVKSRWEIFGLPTKPPNNKRHNPFKQMSSGWMAASVLSDTLLPELNLNAAENEMRAAWRCKTCIPVVSLNCAASNQVYKFNIHQMQQLLNLGLLSIAARIYFLSNKSWLSAGLVW